MRGIRSAGRQKKKNNGILRRLRDSRGMTMAEVLIVVGIMAVLSGIAIVAAGRYRRTIGQMERDAIAKEIFIAAQNHLTTMYGEGYLGADKDSSGSIASNKYGTEDPAYSLSPYDSEKVYYFTVNNGKASGDANDMFRSAILPFGSIDETVRTGGSYVVRYQPGTGTVLDVFYCSGDGTPYGHTLDDSEFAELMELCDTTDNDSGEQTSRKKERQNFNGTNSILGWYGGTEAEELDGIMIEAPSIEVTNAEKLYVTIKDYNKSDAVKSNLSMRLILTGVSSGKEHFISIYNNEGMVGPVSPQAVEITTLSGYDRYTVVLDDVTEEGGKFRDLAVSDTDSGSHDFIPGEQIKIKVMVFSATRLSAIAYSSEQETNSLYESITASESEGALDTARIGNIRHLLNLDSAVSGYAPAGNVHISTAMQTRDMDWPAFQERIRETETEITGSTVTDDPAESVGIFAGEGVNTIKEHGDGTATGYYYPISPLYSLTYDGTGHSITGIRVKKEGPAGLFGATGSLKWVGNLELLDFTVESTGSPGMAGALAGELSDTEIVNVLVRNSTSGDRAFDGGHPNIVSSGTAGGLVGNLANKPEKVNAVAYCAAAVWVKGSSFAGGLIGSVAGTEGRTAVMYSYSGGHTAGNGACCLTDPETGRNVFERNGKTLMNVLSGGTAGGLIGGAGNASLSSSYATGSVQAPVAGGLIGSGNGEISNCYAAGFVRTEIIGAEEEENTDNRTRGAFAGTYTGRAENCSYYMAVNTVQKQRKMEEGKAESYVNSVPLGAVSNAAYEGISAFDRTKDTFMKFKRYRPYENWVYASAYDPGLIKYYDGRYKLKSVNEMEGASLPENSFFAHFAHYGDWPSPETFFVNESK